MAEEQWERWDCDSSSWETHDDTAEEIHDEPELQLPLVRVRNLSAIIEEEERMNDFRHMFAASMFSSCTDLDTLSIDSDRTVRMCNKEKDDEENSCNNEATLSDDVDTKEKEKQSNTTQNDNIEGDRSIPNKHNIENKFKFPTSGPVESQFQIRKRTRRVSCPGAPIRRDLVLIEGGRARAASLY